MVDARNFELKKYDLTMMPGSFLHIIKVLGNDATPSEISRWVLRKPHSVLSMLSTMEKMGLIVKTPNKQRKKSTLIRLTPKGEKACEQVHKIESITKIMSSLSEEERFTLRSHLERLRGAGVEYMRMDPDKYYFRW